MDFRRLTDAEKLWTGYVLGAAILAGCLFIATSDVALSNLLLCLLGGVAGWTAGILVTPYDEEEKTKFSEVSKGFLALGSGYVIAKLEDPIVEAATAALNDNTSGVLLSVALFVACFLVGFLFTLVSRLYGYTEAERKRRRIASLLAKSKEIERKLADARQG